MDDLLLQLTALGIGQPRQDIPLASQTNITAQVLLYRRLCGCSKGRIRPPLQVRRKNMLHIYVLPLRTAVAGACRPAPIRHLMITRQSRYSARRMELELNGGIFQGLPKSNPKDRVSTIQSVVLCPQWLVEKGGTSTRRSSADGTISSSIWRLSHWSFV